MRHKKKTNLSDSPTSYPVGSFLDANGSFFYVNSSNSLYHITTKRCLDSWAPVRVTKTTVAALKNYKVEKKMRFRNGSLITSLNDRTLYYIEYSKRRPVSSPDFLERIGAVVDDAVVVSDDELELHPLGSVIK